MRLRAQNAAVRRSASCEGKIRFSSYSRAVKIASRAAHRHGEKMTAYACSNCGGAHVGTTNPGQSRGVSFDPRQPYIVFARQGDSREHFIGRSNKPDGGKLAEVIAKDGWEVTRVIEAKS